VTSHTPSQSRTASASPGPTLTRTSRPAWDSKFESVRASDGRPGPACRSSYDSQAWHLTSRWQPEWQATPTESPPEPQAEARARPGCQPEPGPAARGATGSLSDCSSWSCAACAAATPSDGTVLPQAARAGAAVRGRRGRGNRDRAAAGNLNSASCPSDAVRSIHKGRWCFTIRFTKRLNYEF